MFIKSQTSNQYRYFTKEQLGGLDPQSTPRHIAIIPDGNRRWARNQNMSHDEGHREGANGLIEIVKAAKDLGVKAITFYLFSTENWTRPEDEVDALMWLLHNFMIDQRKAMLEEGIRVNTIGDLKRLPEYVQNTIHETKQDTIRCDQINMIMALNYGSRDEIRRALASIVEDVENQKINKEDITEELIASYLDTAPWGDPDLLIRTSGEMRVSNYLLWQISYSEVYVTDVLWPDFQPKDLFEAIQEFQTRERRLGGS